MGASSSTIKPTKKKGSKKPWYKNKATRISILVAFTVFAFVVIFVASLEIRMNAPVLLMTSHDYSNIVAFNANTGAFITTQLLDLSETPDTDKDLDLPTYVKHNKIQFRGIITRHFEQITVVNGRHSTPFIATFDCNNIPGWKISTYFGNHNESLAHPYGLTWYEPNKWWVFTTQDTSSLFIFTENGHVVSLPGMREHFPGAVFTLINQTDGIYMDTYIPNAVKFKHESRKQQRYDLKAKSASGIRGVALDAEYGLIFVAAEVLGKILVFDINNNFNNSFNITLSTTETLSPISVLNGGPNFPHTLFVTERQHNNGVWAVKYTQNSSSIWWRAEKVPYLKHATGIALSPDSLFVLSQSTHSILRYSPYSGHFLGIVVHFNNVNPPGIITHNGIGKVGNPVEGRRTLGEQLLYIPSGQTCTVT